LTIFQKRQENETLQRFERQTAKSLSNYCLSEYLLSSLFISQHEVSAFDVQLEATAIIFRRFSIKTASESLRLITIKDDEH